MKDKKEYILCSAVWFKQLPLLQEEPLRNCGISPYNVDCGIVFSGWGIKNINN